MSQDTRSKILDQARVLFNEFGYNNTSTGDIADSLGISKGNLTYYFKKKEDIVRAIIEENPPSKMTSPPKNLKELNEFFKDIQKTIKENAFYFWHHGQLGEIMPEIKDMQVEAFEDNIYLLRGAVEELLKDNILREEAYKGQYESLIDSVLLASIYWSPYTRLKEDSKDNYLEQSWSLIYPFLTDKGEFELKKLLKLSNYEV